MDLASKKETLVLDGEKAFNKAGVILQEPNMSPDGKHLAITLRGSMRETGVWDLTKNAWTKSGDGCQIDWTFDGSKLYRVNPTGNGGTAAPSEILWFTAKDGKQVEKVGFFGIPKNVKLMDLPGRRSHEYFPRISPDMGDDEKSPNSLDMVAATSGIDVVLDGHSHSTIEHWRLPNRNGDTILLTSTGTAFANIGLLTIGKDGHIATNLVPTATLTDIDKAVADTIAAIRAEYDAIGQRPVGYSKTTLPHVNDQGHRIPRMRECAIGNFCAEAYRTMLDADIGWVNGGAFRNSIKPGPLVFNDIYAVFPFDNRVLVASVTGQDILDALEAASDIAPIPNGRFAQVAGLRYTIDTSIASSAVFDSSEVMIDIKGPRRVADVMVLNRATNRYEPLSPTSRYTIATTDYVMNLMGAGFSFPSKKIILYSLLTDAQLVAEYITHNLKGVIKKNAAKTTGNIQFKKTKK